MKQGKEVYGPLIDVIIQKVKEQSIEAVKKGKKKESRHFKNKIKRFC